MTPTGPSITYKALPFPLPPAERELLKRLSSEIYDAKKKTYAEAPAEREARRAEREARQALDIATLQMRERIGVEVIRPSFHMRDAAPKYNRELAHTMLLILAKEFLAGDLRTNFRKTDGAV